MKTRPLSTLITHLAIAMVATICGNIASAGEAGVRIRFGLMDTEPEKWDGSVSVQPGKVALLSGWRFEQDDHANGTESWVASTRAIAANLRTNAQKAKAKAANQGAKNKAGA